ncbi:MAG TPA: hypothetical protein IAB24_04375 [Candidatus Copromonas avistercoris]|nr:hypothetical protein [Candidatus Copromonas avistercoris]
MDEVNIVLGALAALALAAASGFFWKRKNIAAHLSPVRRELKKEKAWLRRGEYNAAMVKGRQNLELLLKLVAEFHGIQLDNTAQAVANAKAGPEKNVFLAHRRQGRRVKKVMTHQQFGWWLDANGYLDRVGKWELNEIRLIGNKAVHENYASKEDAWSQYNYLEDVFKLISEKNAGHERKATDAAEKKRNEGAASCEAKKQMVPAAKKETQKNKTKKKEAKQKEPAKPEQPEAGKAKQKKKKQKTAAKQEAVKNQEAPKKQETAKKQEPPKSQEPAEKKLEEKKQEEKKQAEQAPVKLSASAKRRARRKRAKARQAQAQQAAASQETEARKEPAGQAKKKADAAADKPEKKTEAAADRPQEKPEAVSGAKKRRRPRRRKPKPQAAGNGGVNEAAN